MLKGENIICISSIDWDFIWQGHQEIMSTLAKNGNRVLFIENTGVRSPGIRDISRVKSRLKNYFKGIKGIRRERDNLYIYSPIVLPFPYSWIVRKINRFLLLSVVEKWMRVLNFTDPILWVFLPTGLTLEVIDNIHKKAVIYYCIDNFAVSSPSAKKVKLTEKKLLKRSDLVFVTSKALYDYCYQHNRNVSFFPFGVSIDNFEKARLIDSEKPADLKGINRPIVGYIGGIHKWIDFDLVRKSALECPELNFVFIGPIQTDISSLSGIKNLKFLGNKPHSELPYFIKQFTAAIIPYLISEYTKNVYPTKLNEYLAMEKPVIATALPEIKYFNQQYKDVVYIANNAGEFSDCIHRAIKEDSSSLRNKRLEAARDNSWQARIEKMSQIIEDKLRAKMSGAEERWKESLLVIYNRARHRLLKIALIFAVIYTAIFYTPFIWFLAEPLKITQAPGKAQAIVVFAGGIGESGKALQGFEERVQYAVELYKEGYSSDIIFLSGYMHIFKEPVLIKTLAVSLGVPGGNIVSEDKATNTYENVKLVAAILRKRGWSSILLVSSPYHMRRSSLVFNKVAKDINVIYAPNPRSTFYMHDTRDSWGRTINFEQIKGILHEYLGIVYYWFKGYI